MDNVKLKIRFGILMNNIQTITKIDVFSFKRHIYSSEFVETFKDELSAFC